MVVKNLREGHVLEINKILELMVQSSSFATSQSSNSRKCPMREHYGSNEMHIILKHSHKHTMRECVCVCTHTVLPTDFYAYIPVCVCV